MFMGRVEILEGALPLGAPVLKALVGVKKIAKLLVQDVDGSGRKHSIT
jgi:hypothetical protein